MKAINYWDKFMITGKIDDFLAYKNAQEEEQTAECERKEGAEESSHAGGYTGYRDRFEG